MTESEVCTSYRDARKKAEQIKILAELNNCTKERITKILTAHGYAVSEKKARKARDIQWSVDELLTLLRMTHAGQADCEIGNRLGRSRESVGAARRRILSGNSLDRTSAMSEALRLYKVDGGLR